jgi:GT2 family glycosyltransferase
MISIITSLYKSDKYLSDFGKNLIVFSECLISKKINFEIIVIANDPTETELAFAERFSKENWFRFIKVKREPLYATWNRGINLSEGNVIAFWNVDDVRRADAIIDGIKLIDEGADLVYFPFLIRWYLNIMNVSIPVKRKFILPPEYNKKEFTGSMHCGPFFMFKKSLFQSVGPFDEQFKIVGDFDWCIRAAKITDGFVLSKESAGSFRVDGRGLSSGGKPIHAVENNIVYMRHGVTDKITPINEEYLTKYRPKQILFQGAYRDVK